MDKEIITQAKKSVRKPKILEFNAGNVLPAWVKEAIETNLLIEQEEAKESGSLGFMTRAMVLASMPYKNPKTDVFYRKSGDFTLRIVAGYEGGIPHGIYPRLLLTWLVTEIVRTKNPKIELGDTLKQFLTNTMGVKSTGGGERGSRTAVLEQMKRLFGSLITAQYNGKSSGKGFMLKGIQIANELTLYEQEYDSLFALQTSDYGFSRKDSDKLKKSEIDIINSHETSFVSKALENGFSNQDLGKLEKTELDIINADNIESSLWMPQEDHQNGWKSNVIINQNFFNECLNSPIPIDMRAYNLLRASPMAMDIYSWLTYRMYSIKKTTRVIFWEQLMFQFGNKYTPDKNDPTQHIRNFKRDFLKEMNRVLSVYKKAKVELVEKGIILHPSPTHIKITSQPDLFK